MPLQTIGCLITFRLGITHSNFAGVYQFIMEALRARMRDYSPEDLDLTCRGGCCTLCVCVCRGGGGGGGAPGCMWCLRARVRVRARAHQRPPYSTPQITRTRTPTHKTCKQLIQNTALLRTGNTDDELGPAVRDVVVAKWDSLTPTQRESMAALLRDLRVPQALVGLA